MAYQFTNIFGTRKRDMLQENHAGSLPEEEPSTGHPSVGPGDQPLPILRDERIPASMPYRYWHLFNDPELSPPGLTMGPSVVSPEAFLGLTKQCEFQKSRGETGEGSSGGSPFTPEIQDKPIPLNFRLQGLETYDGGSDPAEHIAVFWAQMALYGTSDALMCRALPTTFRGPARAWFNWLLPSSILSFDQLAKEFEQNFLASMHPRPSMATLLVLSQCENKSLSQFVARISDGFEAFKVLLAIDQEAAINHPRDALARQPVHRRRSSGSGKAHGREEAKGRIIPRNDLSSPRATPPEAQPTRVATPEALASPSKCISFHRDYNHDMEDCRDLQNQTEDLIRRGHLRCYLKEPREATPRPRGPVERQIDIISGGPATDGSNSTARKAYAWSTVEKCPRPELEPEITFRTEEVERSHHNDALAISIRMANAWVKRVMADTLTPSRSSA
ncbi:uncharacterized protein LOC135638651 [Musa acuminata AAA Group]|uniref:uncharacterized protein LOC135638651 n=1 Tax=Musa acuminata AAA Group TaxID=214697 RepID=UPI0031E42E18